MMRQSQTAVIEQNASWSGTVETEPFEAAWAGEAIFFIRALATEGPTSSSRLRVQVSPDGIHWCDEGTTIGVPQQADEVTFARVTHFGGWLRLYGQLDDDASLKVMAYLVLKS